MENPRELIEDSIHRVLALYNGNKKNFEESAVEILRNSTQYASRMSQMLYNSLVLEALAPLKDRIDTIFEGKSLIPKNLFTFEEISEMIKNDGKIRGGIFSLHPILTKMIAEASKFLLTPPEKEKDDLFKNYDTPLTQQEITMMRRRVASYIVDQKNAIVILKQCIDEMKRPTP